MPGYAWMCLDMPGYAWMCLDVPGCAWICLDMPCRELWLAPECRNQPQPLPGFKPRRGPRRGLLSIASGSIGMHWTPEGSPLDSIRVYRDALDPGGVSSR